MDAATPKVVPFLSRVTCPLLLGISRLARSALALLPNVPRRPTVSLNPSPHAKSHFSSHCNSLPRRRRSRCGAPSVSCCRQGEKGRRSVRRLRCHSPVGLQVVLQGYPARNVFRGGERDGTRVRRAVEPGRLSHAEEVRAHVCDGKLSNSQDTTGRGGRWHSQSVEPHRAPRHLG